MKIFGDGPDAVTPKTTMAVTPQFPTCTCEMHPVDGEHPAPDTALRDPFLFLPPPIEFTAEMERVADRYLSHDIDWRYYPAFQAAAFLKPKSEAQHQQRRHQFQDLQHSAEAQGFTIPDSLTRLFMTDSVIDRLHHNCVWPTLPDEIVRLPAAPDYAVFLFLIEGQACGIWHVLLAPDGSHSIINASSSFGKSNLYPPGRKPDPSAFRVYQCMDSINRLLFHYFVESARHDMEYLDRLKHYFDEQAA